MMGSVESVSLIPARNLVVASAELVTLKLFSDSSEVSEGVSA